MHKSLGINKISIFRVSIPLTLKMLILLFYKALHIMRLELVSQKMQLYGSPDSVHILT